MSISDHFVRNEAGTFCLKRSGRKGPLIVKIVALAGYELGKTKTAATGEGAMPV